MKKKFTKIIASLLTAAAVTSVMSGCGGDKGESGKLTYWMSMDPNATTVVSNFGDTPLAKKLSEVTGMTVEYQHPPKGQEAEKFNIMVASDSMPDVIEYNWSKYPGGPDKAIKDGVIIPLNDYIDKAPNFKKYLEEHPELDKQCKTDSGLYYGFPFIRGDEYLLTSSGIIVRQDWLDELGLEVPTTLDEFENMLIQFRDKKGCAAPLTTGIDAFTWGTFSGAFGTKYGFYRDGEEIKYGPYEDSFKDFLTLMNKWYNEKLLDPNFVTLDTKTKESNMLNGISGAAYGSCGSGIGKWMTAASSIPGFNLAGVPYPTLNEGEVAEMGQSQLPVVDYHAVITGDCKDVEAAIKFLDYNYSEEGTMLMNFGIEGESYEMIDGYPTYTELITKNPDGLTMTESLSQYARSSNVGPFVQDKRYMEQYANLPQQQEALKNWMNTNDLEHRFPSLYVEEDELSQFAKISNEVGTYAEEMMCKFIMGVEPLSNFDAFREELKARGIETLLDMYQRAYERYENR